MSDIAISVKNLHKSFKLPRERSSGLKQTIINIARGKRGYTTQHVLRGLDFEVKKGEFFGIVGRNGSGKSTLLKVLAQIYEPEKGSIEVNGSLVPFIELGVGFNPELTGRENVYMNGALLGLSNSEVEKLYPEIVEFAELGRFMNQKLKNYSSGMQVRLAFSIAIRAKSDILILDEVLAVGDEAFQRKCRDYFEEVRSSGDKTVVLVTHDLESVRKFCDRAIMIDSGEISISGSPEDVTNEYSLRNINTTLFSEEDGPSTSALIEDFEVKLLSPKQVDQSQRVRVQISYKTTKDVETNALLILSDLDKNVPLISGRTKTALHKKGTKVVEVGAFDLSQVNDAAIKVVAEVWDKDDNILSYLPDHRAPKFLIRRTDYGKEKAKWAIFFSRGEWE